MQRLKACKHKKMFCFILVLRQLCGLRETIIIIPPCTYLYMQPTAAEFWY